MWPTMVMYWSSSQFPNMVNFLMLLGMMSDDHFSMFFKSLEYSIENTFGVLPYSHTMVCHDCSVPYHSDSSRI